MSGSARVAAVFDVDETVLSVKSMVDFLRFYLDETEIPAGSKQAGLLAEFQAALTDDREPREQLNRRYYRVYTGERADRLRELGARWFAQRRAAPGFVNARIVATLLRHRLAGHLVVAVSGSFGACLEPLRAALGIDHVLCTEPIVDVDGRHTGEIVRSLIGDGKPAALRRLAAAENIALPLSFGYADHISDVPLLELVGHPVAVHPDARLAAHAQRLGWARISPAPR
ncbi:HAD family hydrolase [Actinoalloteichus hymeniacidonis]|uniref:HAD-superfamily subfamily IB hydrolase, TIGR01490 n=1 Tax=Actinoalloteichus hymeniacidonis TaxID=340345 RepID=A0AAC9N0B4_9PSEU|nr:HAD-IB family hydrolase [Actinoalloteichus hymeniacidonis]AOS64756.1 HAD-superfamily subfamily IB hydrolase, TIGR01490 [Actinoalloteichus hymeniacidonis]MBB5907168.1 HAD superfamily hydrolase (TIGR01490 family) [Actinoalloteichus hymeniacidonis]